MLLEAKSCSLLATCLPTASSIEPPVSGAAGSAQFQRSSPKHPDSTVFTVNRETTRVLMVVEFFDPNVWMLTAGFSGRLPDDSRVCAFHMGRRESAVFAGR